MKVTVIEQSASERQLEVVVDAQRVENAFQKAFKKNLKEFALPGFRRGKVPVPMASRYITDSNLVRDVVQDLVPKAFEEATKENNLQPISQPEWDLVQSERGKELVFKATFQISPLLPISGHDGLEVKVEREEVSEQHIQDTLEKMRENHAYFENLGADTALEEGMFATVDYSSSQGGEEIEGGAVKNFLMELNGANYIPGFVENLLGLKAGDQKSFEIAFPEDYNNEQLAGETISFHFTIHDVKKKCFPELNDEFAASHSEEDTLDALKQAIRRRLEEGVQRQADSKALNEAIKTLLEQVKEEDIPAPLRQHHAQRAIRERMYEMSKHGISLEQLLAARGMSQDAWLQEMIGVGLFEARLEVFYRSLARVEGLTVSSEEIDALIAAEAPNHKMKPKQLKAQMQKNGSIDLVEYNLLMEKVQKRILEKVKVTYLQPGEAQEEEKAPAAPAKPSKAKASESKDEDAEPKRTKKKAAAKDKEAPEASEAEVTEEPAKKAKASKKATKAKAKE